ncbi:hypothetical protein L873DRAFT_1801680 [Choiromyces venosus 120613-1]|uniref:Secreted protein n=1 Tax=Choiromyces venosus 120613-1 TaxID=1336337 RepID=A0A3N4JWH6_9PEZI|nr:hypothetical protein L873DRAFT_1801680 [Choiromyces venosus 120613-1]
MEFPTILFCAFTILLPQRAVNRYSNANFSPTQCRVSCHTIRKTWIDKHSFTTPPSPKVTCQDKFVFRGVDVTGTK